MWPTTQASRMDVVTFTGEWVKFYHILRIWLTSIFAQFSQSAPNVHITYYSHSFDKYVQKATTYLIYTSLSWPLKKCVSLGDFLAVMTVLYGSIML